MMKRFICGALATALVVGSAFTAPVSKAVKVPAAAYTFNMNKKSSKVVAVSRKGDTANFTTADTTNGTLPQASVAKSLKITLKYKKGKHGKALYLDRSKSYGAQLKGIKLGSKSWTVSFWTKSSNSVSDFMSLFFTGTNIVKPTQTKWLSITKASWLEGGHTPTIWSHNATLDKAEDDLHFPWFSYQNADGEWVGASSDSKALAITANKWVYITLVVDASNTCEYGTAGEKGYVKSYQAWCYVNGALYGNGTVAKNCMSNKNLFFLGINAWDTPYKGYFDDVQFWKKALTAKQVKKLYKSMK